MKLNEGFAIYTAHLYYLFNLSLMLFFPKFLEFLERQNALSAYTGSLPATFFIHYRHTAIECKRSLAQKACVFGFQTIHIMV